MVFMTACVCTRWGHSKLLLKSSLEVALAGKA